VQTFANAMTLLACLALPQAPASVPAGARLSLELDKHEYFLGENALVTLGSMRTLVPKRELSLDQALELRRVDECVEVTPNAIRLRKTLLDANARRKTARTASTLPGAPIPHPTAARTSSA